MNRAVFLDRDGVIIEESFEYCAPHRLDQMKLISKSVDAIKLLNDNGFLIVIVTNQAGVSKGYFKRDNVMSFNNEMEKELRKKGAKIDAIYYCPHAEDDGCDCRKPRPGMLKKAEEALDIDLKQSFIVGDRISDIEAGKSVGCKAILVLTGYGTEESKNSSIKHDFVANNLHDAAKYIVTSSNMLSTNNNVLPNDTI